MKITSVGTFLETIAKLSPRSGSFLCYRGMRDWTWKNVPGIYRALSVNLLKFERDAVRDLMAVHPSEFSPDTTMFDRLVRMQHYGLPTRLVDVTANPLVALFFATEEVDSKLEPPVDGVVATIDVPNVRKKYFDSDTVSVCANLANMSANEKSSIAKNIALSKTEFNKLPAVDRLLQFIRAEKPYFRDSIEPDDLKRVWYVTPKLSNRRIIAQNGGFLIWGLQVPLSMRPKDNSIQFGQVLIEQSQKQAIRRELHGLGINQAALFPEIDHAAAEIIARYR